MNQINFEREFDERLAETFGDLLPALLNIPRHDMGDEKTVILENGIFRVSSDLAEM